MGVTHGGNNSVTEALSLGVPLVVMPFSTDQFAGAEALERVGFGAALAPNDATVAEIKDALDSMMRLSPETRAALRDLGALRPPAPSAVMRGGSSIRDRKERS